MTCSGFSAASRHYQCHKLVQSRYIPEIDRFSDIHEEASIVKPIAGRPRDLQTSIRHLRPRRTAMLCNSAAPIHSYGVQAPCQKSGRSYESRNWSHVAVFSWFLSSCTIVLRRNDLFLPRPIVAQHGVHNANQIVSGRHQRDFLTFRIPLLDPLMEATHGGTALNASPGSLGEKVPYDRRPTARDVP
jgi:hypothetical protein